MISQPELELQVIILYSNACNESNATKSWKKIRKEGKPLALLLRYTLLPSPLCSQPIAAYCFVALVAGCIKNKRLWPALNLEWNWRKYQKFIQWQMQHKQTRNKQWKKNKTRKGTEEIKRKRKPNQKKKEEKEESRKQKAAEHKLKSHTNQIAWVCAWRVYLRVCVSGCVCVWVWSALLWVI